VARREENPWKFGVSSKEDLEHLKKKKLVTYKV